VRCVLGKLVNVGDLEIESSVALDNKTNSTTRSTSWHLQVLAVSRSLNIVPTGVRLSDSVHTEVGSAICLGIRTLQG
jgi:hypothetical protein